MLTDLRSNPTAANSLKRHSAKRIPFFAGIFLLGSIAFVAKPTVAHADIVADMQKCQQTTSRSNADQQYCNAIDAYKQKNYSQAISDLNASSAAGNTSAPGMLGFMYERGKGVPADPARGVAYYKQGANLGNADAMHELGRCYRNGIGVPVNEPEAQRWFKMAAAHGTEEGPEPLPNHRIEPDQADFEAGAKLYKAHNYSGAFTTFQRAANVGNSAAELQVGSQYERGEGVAKNLVEAVRWYSKSASAGNSIGQKNLGYMYENALGTAENWPLAAQWYQKSANLGYHEGEFALGRCYEFGIGVAQDRKEAIRWFTYAGEKGNPKGAYFAHWLAEPTNFIGFRNDEESKYVMDRIRYAGDFLGGDPAGQTFHNSTERTNFLIAFKNSANFHEAQTQWGVQHNNYQVCMSNQGSGCHNPGPPPAIPKQ